MCILRETQFAFVVETRARAPKTRWILKKNDLRPGVLCCDGTLDQNQEFDMRAIARVKRNKLDVYFPRGSSRSIERICGWMLFWPQGELAACFVRRRVLDLHFIYRVSIRNFIFNPGYNVMEIYSK